MRYATDWSETFLENEEARLHALTERLIAVQASRSAKHPAGRALHRLPIGSARGTFTVRPDLDDVLPEPLRVGPFRAGASYPTYVRFSDGSWEAVRQKDPDVRGIALKLVGVPGKKCLFDAPTQDFLLINTPTFSAATPEEFISLVEVASSGSKLTLLPRLAGKIGWGPAWRLLRGLLGAFSQKFPSYATGNFNSVSVYRLGPTAVKWGLVPVSTDAAAPAGKTLVDDLAARLPKGGIAWDFRVQLYQDATTTPIEDVTVAWQGDWHTLGRLELSAQDPASSEGQALSAYVERLSFDPWHACTDLAPLGITNRARKVAYFASIKNRETLPEPDGSEQIGIAS